MAIQLIFNELSSTELAYNDETANARIVKLLEVIRRCTRLGAERALRVTQDFGSVKLCANSNIFQWMNKPNSDEALVEYVRDIITNLMFLDPFVEIAPDYEFRYRGETAIGLGIAALTGNLSVGFELPPHFVSNSVDLERFSLNEEGEIEEDLVTVPHASTISHVEEHAAWIVSQREIVAFSEEIARNSIDRACEDLQALGFEDFLPFEFGGDFCSSARNCGFFLDNGLRHILAETCARILVSAPKNGINIFHVSPVKPGWVANRTHLTKAGPGFRLMFWTCPNGSIVFANVGPKYELEISYSLPETLPDISVASAHS